MSIELLWLIPILAVAVFVFIQILLWQRRKSIGALESQVRDYNSGLVGYDGSLPVEDRRLQELEGTIKLVSAALSNQQKLIEGYQGKDTHIESELQNLKKRLSEVQHEYDMTLSENYALKARLKKGHAPADGSSPGDLRLNDTRTYRAEDIARQLEDTKSLRQEDFDQDRQ